MASKLLTSAQAYFEKTDPVMSALLNNARNHTRPLVLPKPERPRDYFSAIVSTIIGQQISTKAAASVRARLLATLGTITPEHILGTDPAALRACGLSPQKLSYITKNAHNWPNIPYQEFSSLSDEAVITELTKLYGIGRWTAEMFCIFTLARPDVFSFGDLGLMQSLYHYYNYKPHYTRKIEATVATFQPYRSVAALALWHARDTQFEVH
jgi:DNA-3-methyladenine glycosylase II